MIFANEGSVVDRPRDTQPRTKSPPAVPRPRIPSQCIPMVLGAACLLALAAGPGTAQPTDTVGFYFDLDTLDNELFFDTLPITVPGYLVLHNPSAPEGVAGWELCAELDGPASWLGWELEGQALNVATPPCFVVGLGTPLPPQTNVLLATTGILVIGEPEVVIALVPPQPSSLPNAMAYLAGDYETLVPLQTVTGTDEVAWITISAPDCQITPAAVDFGEVPTGTAVEATITVTNSGTGTLSGLAALPDTCPAFTIVAGGGPFAIEGGESHEVRVSFAPDAVAEYACDLELGTDCATVPLAGIGVEPLFECSVEPELLDFGLTEVGSEETHSFTVSNTGNMPLDGDVAASCADFTIGPTGAFTLAPGEQVDFAVTFAPSAPGEQTCEIDLGLTECGPVACVAMGFSAPLADQDLIGIYFDAEATINEIVVVDTPATIPAYLVAKNLSQSSVAAWELCAELEGPAGWLEWQLAGEATNALTAPCFDVGLATPLPPAPDLLLAEFSVLLEFPVPETVLRLVPIPQPSLPDAMSYAPGADLELHLPLDTVTGFATVAWINRDLPFCEVSTDSLTFDDTAVGETATASVTITNIGGGVLAGEVSLDDMSDAFALLSGGGAYELAGGDSRVVEVAFTPQAIGEFTATLLTGADCDPVALLGNGLEQAPGCALDPAALDFGDRLVGEPATESFTLINTGNVTLAGDLAVTGDAFSLDEPGPFTLPPQGSLVRAVTFLPPAEETYTGLVATGLEPCAELPLTGNGVVAIVSCLVEPEELDFPPTEIGDYANLTFTITNDGNLDLSGFVQENCPDFCLNSGGGAFTLAPGEERIVDVLFSPSIPGEQTCEIDLGTEACGSVFCTGNGYGVVGEPDVMGIYFDPYFHVVVLETGLPGVFPAYLVIQDPQAPGGVAGWECCIRATGVHTLGNWSLDYPHINTQSPPCFQVQIDTPLPPAAAVVVATFDVIVEMEGGSDYYLNPILNPTIPGQFSYWGPGGMYVPLRTITHRPWAAASIYDPEFAGGLEPSPLGTGGGVLLRWPAPPGEDVVYHVLRRVGDGPAVQVTDAPVQPSGGKAIYQDHFTEKSGAPVYYSVVAEVGGIEVARSEEVAWTSDTVPSVVTLEPNHPNPFNPQTTLSFLLPAAGPARLSIYDLSGRRVAVLIDEPLEAGRHEHVWLGRDDSGRPLPSGAYYARLDAGGATKLIKMTLLK